MNDAVMSQCQSLVIQLSSASFMLWPVGSVCACMWVCACVLSCRWVTDTQAFRNWEFIPEGPQRPLWDTRKWWNGPLRRCERAKQRKEWKDTSWSPHQKLLSSISRPSVAQTHSGIQLTSMHRRWPYQLGSRAVATSCSSGVASSNLAHKLWCWERKNTSAAKYQ